MTASNRLYDCPLRRESWPRIPAGLSVEEPAQLLPPFEREIALRRSIFLNRRLLFHWGRSFQRKSCLPSAAEGAVELYQGKRFTLLRIDEVQFGSKQV